MNKDGIEQFKQRLLDLRSELQESERAYKESGDSIELDQTRVGRLSRMDAMQVHQMAKETSRRRQHQLLKIEGALRRIDSDEYGDCFVCGKEIDVRRLSANPTSTRCMGCVEK